jgi:hypothetical protein
MTEREPFAMAIQLLSGSENRKWGIVIDGIHLFSGSKQDSEDRAFLINEYFENRLSEELAKAVEGFREKAIKEIKKMANGERNTIENTGGALGDSGAVRAFMRAVDIVKAIPTEPEEAADGK